MISKFLNMIVRWYPQQPQCFIFTNLSEACCEAKRWKHLSWVVNQKAANPVEPDLALHQSFPDILRNILRNPIEPDLTLHQSLPACPELERAKPEPCPEPC